VFKKRIFLKSLEKLDYHAFFLRRKKKDEKNFEHLKLKNQKSHKKNIKFEKKNV